MPSRGPSGFTHPILLWSGFALVLLVVRNWVFPFQAPVFLYWNLFLALIPYVVSIGMAKTDQKIYAFALGCIWLAFLPNAFYLVTDIMHLSEFAGRRRGNSGPAPLRNQDVLVGFDLTLLVAFAVAGFGCGYGSLRNALKAFNLKGLTAHLFAHAILWLCAIGLYLGRVERFNSWDILYRSHKFVDVTSKATEGPREVLGIAVFIACYGCMMSLGYMTLFGRHMTGKAADA